MYNYNDYRICLPLFSSALTIKYVLTNTRNKYGEIIKLRAMWVQLIIIQRSLPVKSFVCLYAVMACAIINVDVATNFITKIVRDGIRNIDFLVLVPQTNIPAKNKYSTKPVRKTSNKGRVVVNRSMTNVDA